MKSSRNQKRFEKVKAIKNHRKKIKYYFSWNKRKRYTSWSMLFMSMRFSHCKCVHVIEIQTRVWRNEWISIWSQVPQSCEGSCVSILGFRIWQMVRTPGEWAAPRSNDAPVFMIYIYIYGQGNNGPLGGSNNTHNLIQSYLFCISVVELVCQLHCEADLDRTSSQVSDNWWYGLAENCTSGELGRHRYLSPRE